MCYAVKCLLCIQVTFWEQFYKIYKDVEKYLFVVNIYIMHKYIVHHSVMKIH